MTIDFIYEFCFRYEYMICRNLSGGKGTKVIFGSKFVEYYTIIIWQPKFIFCSVYYYHMVIFLYR